MHCAAALVVSLLAMVSVQWRACATDQTGESPKAQPDVKKAVSVLVQIAKGVSYCRVEIDPLAIAHVVKVDTKSGDWSIRPYMSDQIETTSSLARKLEALVAVNAGFFNLSDGESASYIVVDGKQVCEPKRNMALVNNVNLKPFLTQIFNRAELRFLEDEAGRNLIKIQQHCDSIPAGSRLIHSIQAGPQLLPELTSRQEAFVRRPPGAKKESDSIGTNMRAARTAFGIIGDGTVVFVCVQGLRTKEFSEGISLPALADFMRQIGCQSAINFDGGSSTTMVVRLPQTQTDANSAQGESSSNAPVTVVASSPERKVKSIVYISPRTGN